MRNARFRRLGVLGVATTLALVGAVLSPAARRLRRVSTTVTQD